MSSLLAILIICSVIYAKEILEPNWQDFQKHSDVNRAELVRFLHTFPISSYWDTLKGEYRTGALGENVQNIPIPAHLSFITWLDKQVLQNNKLVKIRQPIVDHNLLFMLMIISVQDLSELSEHLLHLSGGYEQQYDFKAMTAILRQQNLTSTADVETSLQIAEIEGKLISLQREVEHRRAVFAQMSEAEQATWKQEAKTSLHQKLLTHLQTSTQSLNAIYQEKWNTLEQRLQTDVDADFERQQQSLQEEFQDSVKALEEEIQTTFALIAYRADEEKKALKLMEEISVNITSARAQSQLQSTEEVLNVISTEITNTITEIVKDPWFVWIWGRMILAMVVTIVVVVELSRSLHILLYHWQRSSKRLYSQQQYLPSWWNQIFSSNNQPPRSTSLSLTTSLHTPSRLQSIENGDQVVSLLEQEMHLIFSSDINHDTADTSTKSSAPRTQLARIAKELFVAVDVHAHPYVQSYASFARHAVTPLPNLLFYGPAGCGKSETARQLAHYISQDTRAGHHRDSGYIVLSGADLLALGEQAGHYVRDLFQRHGLSQSQQLHTMKHNAEQSKTTILIIDEADEIICTRDHTSSMVYNASTNSDANVTRSSDPNSTSSNPEEETPASTTSSTNMDPNATMVSNYNTTSPHHVLYSLLEGLRSPNLALSVVFTTRLSLSQIDSALLDRMDHVLPFPRPGPVEALKYMLTHFVDILGDFFPSVENQQNEVLAKLSALQQDTVAQKELLQLVASGDTWKVCQPLFVAPSSIKCSTNDVNSNNGNNEEGMDLLRDDVSVTSITGSTASAIARRQSQRLVRKSLVAPPAVFTQSQQDDDRPEISHLRPMPTLFSNTRSAIARNTTSTSTFASPIQQFLADYRPHMIHNSLLRNSFALETCLQLMILHACRLPIITPSSTSANKAANNNSKSSQAPNTRKKAALVTTTSVETHNVNGWSYRDFHKKLMNIRYAALCSENCRVTTQMWLDELLQAD